MATTEELLARKKWLSNKIASIAKVDITATTAAKRLASMEETKKYRAELNDINKQLAGQPKTPPKKTNAAPLPTPIKIAENAPAFITEDIAADLAAQGIDVSSAAAFQAGGVGSTAFVFLGETTAKPGGLKFKGGKPVSIVTPTTKLASNMVNEFWTDEALQSKIIGSYAAKGQSLSKLEAYGVWEKLVNTAATIYQGGKGAKVTPMELLNDTLKSVQGTEPTLPTRSISKLDKKTTMEQIDAWAQKNLMTAISDVQKTELFDILNTMNTGTVTEYKKVRNKKTGKMENVQVTTPGLTAEKAQLTVEEKLKQLNPDDYDRAQRIKFSDWLSQNVEGA